MIHAQNTKSEILIMPASVATAATASGVLDTKGYKYALIDVNCGTGGTAATELKLAEGDTTSAFTDITALVGGGTGVFSFPAANTSTAPIVRMNVDLRGRKRYLKLTHSPGVTSIIGANAVLMRADQTPSSNANSTGVTANA